MALTPDTALRKDRRSGVTSLQHRHFATIAAIIADFPGDREALAQHFGYRLQETNANFDSQRFIRACGVEV